MMDSAFMVMTRHCELVEMDLGEKGQDPAVICQDASMPRCLFCLVGL